MFKHALRNKNMIFTYVEDKKKKQIFIFKKQNNISLPKNTSLSKKVKYLNRKTIMKIKQTVAISNHNKKGKLKH